MVVQLKEPLVSPKLIFKVLLVRCFSFYFVTVMCSFCCGPVQSLGCKGFKLENAFLGKNCHALVNGNSPSKVSPLIVVFFCCCWVGFFFHLFVRFGLYGFGVFLI